MTTIPEQPGPIEFPVVPVPESEYTGAAWAVFADAFREQFQAMFTVGVDQDDASELAHMYAIAVAEEHIHKTEGVRNA